MSTLKVGTIQDHANGNTAITIDSSGRILTPARPAFLAAATGNGNYVSVAAGTPFPANTTFKNIGNHYNTSTYKFTAPIAGFYLFTWSALTNNTGNGSRPCLYVNNSTTHPSGLRPVAGNDNGAQAGGTTSYSVLCYLAVNDAAFMGSDGGNLYYYGNTHNHFSGCLIG